MAHATTTRLVKNALVSTMTLTLVSLLAGCAPAVTIVGPAASPSPSVSPSASPSPAASTSPSDAPSEPAPSPSASAPPADEPWVPVAAGCLDLVSLDTMYQFDPNFGLQPESTPTAGSPQALAAANGGLFCGWVQATSGDLIEISVATPGVATLADLESRAGDSVGDRTYFSSDAVGGTVQIFTARSWATLSSSYFESAADAQLLTDSVRSVLG